MFATKAGSLRKALWNKSRNKSSDTPPESSNNSHKGPRHSLKTQQSVGFEPEVSAEEPTTPNPCENLSISIEESPNEYSSSCSSPSSARVYRQHSCSATSIPEDEPLDNTTRNNRPPSRLSIKESLKSRIPPFLGRTRVKSANPVLGQTMPSVSLTSPTGESVPKSPLSVSVDCTCDIESAAMPSADSPTSQQLLSTSYKPSNCQLHYSASERHHRSNSSSPKGLYGSLLVPLKNSRSIGSNEMLLKRNSLSTKYSPNFYLPSMSDHPTVFDFEDLSTLDPRKYLMGYLF